MVFIVVVFVIEEQWSVIETAYEIIKIWALFRNSFFPTAGGWSQAAMEERNGRTSTALTRRERTRGEGTLANASGEQWVSRGGNRASVAMPPWIQKSRVCSITDTQVTETLVLRIDQEGKMHWNGNFFFEEFKSHLNLCIVHPSTHVGSKW